MESHATLYDGATAYPHAVRVEARDGALHIATGENWSETVDRALLRVQDGPGSTLRLGRSDVPGWRLLIGEPVDPAIAELVPNASRYGGWVDRLGLGRASAIFAAIAAVVLALGYAAPAWLAPHIPLAWERNVGDAIVGDFGDLRCRNAKGQQALEALAERLEPGITRAGPRQVQLAALDVDLFNAAALPGGHIVVFKGALDETDNADALAGIIAHEIAHVRRRHVAEAMVRELGIGALIRTFAGDIGANAQQLVGLSYTRDNEREADADAIAALRRAGIDPRPTAKLFGSLAGKEGKGVLAVEFLNSHPGTKGRAERFAAAFDKTTPYRPALDPVSAKALMTACGN
jgi:Zn-dependent protease with chaperone function